MSAIRKENSRDNFAHARFYARAFRTVSENPTLSCCCVAACAAQGVGQATLACLLASAVGMMTGTVTMMGNRSIVLRGWGSLDARALLLENPTQFGVVLGLAVLTKVLGQWGASVTAERLATRTAARVRRDVFGAEASGEPSLVAQSRQVDHGTRVSVATDEVRRGVLDGLVARVRAWAELVPLALVAAVAAPRWALAAIALFAPLFWGLARARSAQKKQTREWLDLRVRAQSALGELFGLLDVLRVFGKTKRADARLVALESDVERASVRGASWTALASGANEVVGALFVLALVARASQMPPAERAGLVPLIACVLLAYRPLKLLNEARAAQLRAEAALSCGGFSCGGCRPPRSFRASLPLLASLRERVGDNARRLVARRCVDASLAGRAREAREEVRRESSVPRELVLRDVTLAHGALPPLSVRVRAGEHVAFMGATGLGKTTLLRALLGLEPLADGSIRWGDARIDGADVGRARPFAWVPQHAPMLRAGLFANVALLEERMLAHEQSRIGRLFAHVGAEDLVRREATEQLDCTLLSGGEKQLVAIVRALATDAPVLLLDEPTSGLDAESEARVCEALVRIAPSRTVIVVTHRASTAHYAERIVTLSARTEARDDASLAAE